ncbi:MAG: RagB/SusD family nutrient uptake outer membrane protein [Bacteroidota bacterium]
MKKIVYIYGFISLLALLTGCDKDLLEKYPLDEVSSADFLKTSNDQEIYLNHFYPAGLFFPTTTEWGADRRGIYSHEINSDNQVFSSVIDERLHGTRTVPASGGGWSYYWVREINYYFDNYKKIEEPFESYKQYLGEAHFFRALIFYNLVQAFGDVVWLSTVPETNSDLLYSTRTPRNEVVDKIIADLDSAALYLTEDRIDDGTRINKWYALAMQSRIALYEGSWEKYHAGDPFGVSNPDPNKYFNKAVEAAGVVMNSGNFEVYTTGHPESDYYDYFGLPDHSNSKSTLFWHKFSIDLELTNTINVYGRFPYGEGLTKGLIDSYLCSDGDPISVSPLFAGYDTIVDEMKNRDPRLRQSVWSPEAPLYIDGADTTFWEVNWVQINKNANYLSPTAYANRKGFNAHVETQNLAGEETPYLLFRYAEVLLNFAEAKAELGSITQADIDRSIKLLRDRVGMPNLNISNITNDPNWDFPTLSPIINEIRRERRVELVSEGIRWHDVARWAAAEELIAGKRPKGIRAGNQLPFNTYPLDTNGFLDPFAVALYNGYGFDINRDYLDPLPINEITLNPKLGQNPGW